MLKQCQDSYHSTFGTYEDMLDYGGRKYPRVRYGNTFFGKSCGVQSFRRKHFLTRQERKSCGSVDVQLQDIMIWHRPSRS